MNASSDSMRRELGFRTQAEVEHLVTALGVRVLDPHSILIAASADLAPGVLVYPNCVIQSDGQSRVEVGANSILYPGTFLLAVSGGTISVGSECELGPGGVQVKANREGVAISIGDHARLLNGCEVVGDSLIGVGAQIIGTIAAQSVRLEGGLGGHEWPDPDERGAVLKGSGLARGIHLRRGDVVNATGSFADAPVERQLAYHPRQPGADLRAQA